MMFELKAALDSCHKGINDKTKYQFMCAAMQVRIDFFLACSDNVKFLELWMNQLGCSPKVSLCPPA
jgi:hypothetical protein